ncbi:MAG: glycoside hydrolase N-terminal domain-containing protein [Akkermansiaceae bacterium]|nr:glycoside hydrolase N-terminal domain-containing protein [Akkermansiaceae bacterium]MDP4779113.1 glycoside hydrolase N-terminal domain-containing protein [Akkermansiaceae bacterium]MDP4995954.1 glycoside hydrolase N-terminal domain-containing protein [Akkermansiaceae bacterium]
MKLKFPGTIVCLLGLVPALADDTKPNDRILWYSAPATDWETQALPLGNGRLGCMVFGGIAEERIQFNEDSLWLGDEKDTGAYQAFGDLFIRFGSGSTSVTNPSKHNTTPAQDVTKSTDGDPSTKWCMEHNGKPVIWEIAGSSLAEKPLTSYTFTSANDVPARDPMEWILYGSADGSDWKKIDERKETSPFAKRGQVKTFEIDSTPSPYAQYRIVFQPTEKTHFQIADIRLGDGVEKAPDSYRRELDIENSVHRVEYEKEGTTFTREAFASRPAEALVFRFKANKPGAYTGSIELTDMHGAVITSEGDTITSTGSLKGVKLKMGKNETSFNRFLDYEAQVKVQHEGGSITSTNGGITFEGCDSITVMLVADTNYDNRRSNDWKKEHPHQQLTEQLASASSKTFEQLMEEHLTDYRSLYGTLELDLGTSPEETLNQPTNERLDSYRGQKVEITKKTNMGAEATNPKGGKPDPDLEELLYQYARYLMISCSRPGALPANLQGLWNQSNSPPWRSDYHSDVNIQMNYWFVDAANLSECFLPLAEWVNSIRDVRKEATNKEFGARGWLTRAENGIFGGSTYKWSKGDSSWIAQNLWDHYAFTLDEEYLRTRAYPVMKELCEFWEDHLKELPDGSLVSPDGWSPEHGPIEDGVSFDQQLIWDLFTNFIEASEILGEDEVYREKVASMKSKLLGPQIGKWGQLQEWMVDRDDPKNSHRHVSQLVGLHPGRQISPLTTPELAEAAKVTLNGRGDGGTGWSKAWKISFWARLHDGDRSYKLLREQIFANIYDNLFDTHPPFQIDGNFGYAAGICEMLVQSHMNGIQFLPALPDVWPDGEIRGIRARGGFEINLNWRDGEMSSAEIISLSGGECRIYSDKALTITCDNEVVPTEKAEGVIISFPTEENKTYVVSYR